MAQKILKIEYTTFNSERKLDPADQVLVEAAEAASQQAYAPFSKFLVGAALRLGDGIILSSNNQENEAFPSGLCAERSLLYYTTANYPTQKIETLAVVAYQSGERKEISPCGTCRQTIVDIQKRQKTPLRIILVGREEITILPDAFSLIPFHFEM